MPEEDGLHDAFFGLWADFVQSLATGEGEVLWDVGVGGVKFLGPAVI